mmetsp:Transcript_36582/g.67683  ORF Transcript_36582/g.67683 Transcript_36582/m.67683 type:complete len:92 (-) Transcript_36582:8-283(-)
MKFCASYYLTTKFVAMCLPSESFSISMSELLCVVGSETWLLSTRHVLSPNLERESGLNLERGGSGSLIGRCGRLQHLAGSTNEKNDRANPP